MKKIILTMGSLLFAGSLFAQWQQVDDMESYTVDTEVDADADPLVSTGPWNMYRSADDQYASFPFFGVRADPFGGDQGQVLELHPGVPANPGQGNTTLERALPEGMQVLDPLAGGGDKATFYFRYARPIVEGVPAQSDTTWGLSAGGTDARNAETGQLSYGSYSVLGRTEIDGIIDIRNGGDYIDLVLAALETNTWYEFWFVIDHGANTFSQYIKGGTDFPEQTALTPADAAYRFATFAALDTILLITTTGNETNRKGVDPVYFDDFHVDTMAENLTSPAASSWVKVDDMESYTVDTEVDADPDPLVSTGAWNMYRSADDQYASFPFFGVRADPFGGDQGQVLELHPGVPANPGQGNTTLERALPEGSQILDPLAGGGDMATFYFRYARPIVEGVPAQSDTTWGLSAGSTDARNAETGQLSYGSYSVLGRTEIDGIIDIRNGGDYIDLVLAALETNTWYEFWFVVDHGANTFSQYIKGGSDFPEQTALTPADAAYRFATFAALDTILLITTTGNETNRKGVDPVYFDDFHIDPTGENLASPGSAPTPPPASNWQEVDDMESYTVDTEVDADPDPLVVTGAWNMYRSADDQYASFPFFGVRADPFGGAQGQVLELHPGVPANPGQGNTTLERALPEGMQILDPLAGGGDMATFYFRYARPIVEGVPAQSDTTWGLSAGGTDARNAETGQLSYGSYSVLGRTEIDGIIDIRNGGDYIDLVLAALETNTWYEFWFVVDHGANTFSQYIKGGSDFPTQTALTPADAAYRFATFAALDTILLITTTGNETNRKGVDPVYFDDFHIDVTGENLTSPGAPVVDTTPRAEETAAGSTTITMTAESAASAEVGQLVFLDDGTELGKIASIAGQVITLEAGSAAAIPAGSRLTFVDDNVDPPAIAGQLINLSTRSQVGTGDDVLIGGFVVGVDSQQVLIQAVGPELANSGVAGPLLDPFLTITNTGTNEVVTTNDNWQDTQGQLISDLWGGAPPMADQSLSAGAVVTLEPGTYTATISGVGDTTGVALIEVYELD